MSFKIADVADLTGLTPRAIRYYEERGLIVPQRDVSGVRLYDAVSRGRLLTIAALRRAGLTLEDISHVLAPASSGEAVDRGAAAEKLKRQRAALQQVLQQIELALTTLAATGGEADHDWQDTAKALLELDRPAARVAPAERDYGLHRASGAARPRR